MNMKYLKIAAFILSAVFIAFVLNPSGEKHRAKIKENTANQSSLLGVIGVGQYKALVSRYNSYGVFSYTKIDDQIATVGFLGAIFMIN